MDSETSIPRRASNLAPAHVKASVNVVVRQEEATPRAHVYREIPIVWPVPAEAAVFRLDRLGFERTAQPSMNIFRGQPVTGIETVKDQLAAGRGDLGDRRAGFGRTSPIAQRQQLRFSLP
jgi:hypothetical protein